MSKKFYTAVALGVTVLAQVSFAAWNGSAKVPKVVTENGQKFYEITSPEELIGFLDSVTTANTGKESIKAYLKNDIVFGADTSKLSDKRWNNRDREEYFVGDFDGRGHTIYGVNAEHALFGLIGTSAGSVHDFNVANSSFGSDSAVSAAAIAEHLHARIWNVNVYNTDVRALYYAGGIAAYMSSVSEDDGRYAMILNSNVVGGSVSANGYVGGIAGFAAGRILGSTNSARVYFANDSLKENDPNSNVYIGGIAGYSKTGRGTAIASCINHGDVEIESPYMQTYAGGIAGSVLGNMENLQNYGKVTAKVLFASDTAKSFWSSIAVVGGIAGAHLLHVDQSSDNRDFLNAGNVLGVLDNRIEKGKLMVGGIVGESDKASLTNALNRGSVTAYGFGKLTETYVGGDIGWTELHVYSNGLTKLRNRGDVYGSGTFRTHVGGVVGSMEGPFLKEPGLRQSFNYGDVTGVVADTSSESEALNVGGIAGYCNAVVISDVYNRGKLLAEGKLSYGDSYVGGILGLSRYPSAYVANAYSASPSLKGDSVGGVVGYALDIDAPRNTYFDKTLAGVKAAGKNYNEIDYPESEKKTSELQSDEMLVLLNTEAGAVADRKLWVRRGGYPVLSFDSLYKNDSIYFDVQQYAFPASKVVDDTVVYTISTADELSTLLEAGTSFGYKKFKVQLSNDIVMGEDSVHLSMRKTSIDTSGRCFKMNFDGQNHTIYGLNMTRAMFFCVDTNSIVENLTIANSRFENDYGTSAAAVAIKNGGCIRNVTVRNSLVRGGESVGGIVAYNQGMSYGVLMNSKNENTTVMSTNIAGGIAGESYGVLQNLINSGRVYGRVAGGIVGYAYKVSNGDPAYVGKNTNTGMVLVSGESSVSGGGIAGHSHKATVSSVFNTGLVEGASVAGILSVGGIIGSHDSTKVMDSGNWGRVHALSGKTVYAGGIEGRAYGYIYYVPAQKIYSVTTPVSNSFNYGPVTVKAAAEEAYAGGIVGKSKGVVLQTVYNRGEIKNESPKSVTGGFIATMDTSIISNAYSYVDVLSGDKVANVAYEVTGSNDLSDIFYGANFADYQALGAVAENAIRRDTLIKALNFEKMKFASISQESSRYLSNPWVDNGCLPVFAYDTTSACAESVVKDSFGDSDEPYVVGYKETVVLAEAGSGSGEGPVAIPKSPLLAKVAPLNVQVVERNIAVSGLSENRPVLVMDMQGRLVKSVRAHGPSVNVAVPRAGRYIVRCGSLARIVTVR